MGFCFPTNLGTAAATAEGCSRLDSGKVDRMVWLRPHVTSENFGFLPGTLEEKMDPLMRPLYDVAIARLSVKRFRKYLEEEKIEVAALAYLRGRTFSNSWVIFDEAQNSTIQQMKMVLTRIGDNCTLIIAGDPSQSDLEGTNGLVWAREKLIDCPIVCTTRFTSDQVVRSKTVKELLKHLGE